MLRAQPGLHGFIERAGSRSGPTSEFKAADVVERGQLYREIAKQLWNPDDLLAVGTGGGQQWTAGPGGAAAVLRAQRTQPRCGRLFACRMGVAHEGSGLVEIAAVYRPVVEDCTAVLTEMFGGWLHSLYLYGSVATGQARPPESDVDLIPVWVASVAPEG